MGRKKAEPEQIEVPVLPPFPTEGFNLVVTFRDGTSETIKVMAKGVVAALRTAIYSMERWTKEKQPEIQSVNVTKP